MEESEKKTLMHETLYIGNHIILGFTVGNGSMFKIQVAAIIGNDFYFRVYAIGMSGQSTGVYTILPGQNAQKYCTVTFVRPKVV